MEIKRLLNKRIFRLGLIIFVLFAAITTRLWWIQSVDAAWIMEQAKKQWERDKDIKPKRGAILDRNLQLLAYEGNAYAVNATLKPRNATEEKNVGNDYVKDPFYTATKLSPILGTSVEELVRYMTQQNVLNVELGKNARKITEEQKNQILALQYPKNEKGEVSEVNMLPGISLWDTSRRFYPHNAFLSQVLGYYTYEDKAQMGIEQQFDKELRGEPGYLQVMKDGAGFQLPEGEQAYKPAKDGLNVVLTIDQQIQEYAEQALDEAEKAYNPKHMMAIVTDPQSGDILAMANRPDFNPNQYWDIKNFTNDSISFMFEPGSTFKIITLAAAIQEGKFNPNEKYLSGMYKKGLDKPIKDHNNGQGWGSISFLEGIQHSSNVAFVILGYERLKQELLSKYFDAFGVGAKTQIELPGEGKGIMRDLKHPLAQRDVAVTTFGQGVAVTAIQQVAAVGAIANGGELLKPQIVKEFRDPHTNQVVKKNERQVVRRVVSEATAKQTRDLVETVVTGKYGTGKKFAIPGYHVAGKTGTAQKYDPETGKILDGQYIYSFIGFAPKDKPRLLVYVIVDDPQSEYNSSEVGGMIVAPIFKSIMGNSLQYLNQQPDARESQTEVPKIAAPVYERIMPNMIGMATSTADMRAKKEGFKPKIIGSGTKIVKQFPDAMEKVAPDGELILVTDKVTSVVMPDFTGKSLREVMEFTSLIHLPVSTVGTGYVSEQSIKSGSTVTGKEKLLITLKPFPGASDTTVEPVASTASTASTATTVSKASPDTVQP